ncbi:MAG: tetratricopeptide repeat protein [Spirochaetes bacterium]|nr:tetratricopeptide repeat protein [Spirochaetota bacterium]
MKQRISLKLAAAAALLALAMTWAQGVAGGSPEALLTSPELVNARMKYVKRLADGQKYREALRELLELRTEVPRSQGLLVDYTLAMSYRAIADAICEGYMGENERGELIYLSEAPGYGAWGTNTARMSETLPASNAGRPVTNWAKRSRQVVLEQGPDFITNIREIVTVATNPITEVSVTSNQTGTESVTTNVEVRETYTTNRTPQSREETFTLWNTSSNASFRPVVVVTSNISILSNMKTVTNKNRTKVAEDISFESEAYTFYPGSFSGVKMLRNIQIQTNYKLTTILTVTTNQFVVTNWSVTSNQTTEKRTVAADDLITVATNREEIPREVRTGANTWAVQTNQNVRYEYVTNRSAETNVVAGPGTKYGTVEETVPVVTWVAVPVELPKVAARSRRLTPLALKYYDLSVRWLNRLVANSFENPYQESAALRKGEIYRDIEQPTLAVEVFSQFQRQFPRSKQVLTAMIERANLYVAMGRPGDAETVLLEALEVFPDSDQKDFIRLKIETLRSLSSAKATSASGEPRNELERKARLLERFESELRKKELRLRDLDKPIRP